MSKHRAETWEDRLSVDFSAEAQRKEEIKQTLLERLDEQAATPGVIHMEERTVEKAIKRRRRPATILAVAVCLLLVVSATALAVGGYFNLGSYATYSIDGMTDAELVALLEEVEEDVFDRNGDPIVSIAQTEAGYYDADGNALTALTHISGEVIDLQPDSEEWSIADVSLLVPTLDEAQQYLAFPALEFGYVPEGYTLEGYRIYIDGGEPQQDTKYLFMTFYSESGDEISVQARLMDEETQFTSSGPQDAEKTTINGYEAVITRNNVDMLIGDVLYMISGGNQPQEEVIRMAESLTR